MYIILFLILILIAIYFIFQKSFVIVEHPKSIKVCVIDGIDEIGLYTFPYENGVLTINDNYEQIKPSLPLNDYYYNRMILNILVTVKGIEKILNKSYHDITPIKNNYSVY